MKIPFEPEFGESVIVVLRTTVQAVNADEVSVEVITNAGAFSSDDHDLIAVFPDPSED